MWIQSISCAEVRAYRKDPMEMAGAGGRFIPTKICGIDHAKDEKVRVMIETSKEYSVYR